MSTIEKIYLGLYNVLSYKFSIKEFLFFLFYLLFLMFLLFVLYSQNKQIHELLLHIGNLQDQYKSLHSQYQDLHNNISSLSIFLNEKNSEILELKEIIKNINSISVINNSVAPIDSEIIRAQTERRELYIKTALIILGSLTLLSIGFSVANNLSGGFGLSLKSFLPKKFIVFGGKFGLFLDVKTHHKHFLGSDWKVNVIDSGADLNIHVKTPGSDNYVDAMQTLFIYMNRAEKVKVKTSSFKTGNTFNIPDTSPSISSSTQIHETVLAQSHDVLSGTSNILNSAEVLSSTPNVLSFAEFIASLPTGN